MAQEASRYHFVAYSLNPEHFLLLTEENLYIFFLELALAFGLENI